MVLYALKGRPGGIDGGGGRQSVKEGCYCRPGQINRDNW